MKSETSEATANPEEQTVAKKDKKYVNPVLGYSVFGGTLVLAIAIALIVLLPLL